MLQERPYITASVAMSLDGCIDDCSKNRLLLSCPEDLEEIDMLRSRQDAIFVGAETVRSDNPRLLLYSELLKQERIQEGKCPDLIKITLTSSGSLDSELNFFKTGQAEKIVYCAEDSCMSLAERISNLATVVSLADGSDPAAFIVSDLYNRGIRKLLVEGGQQIHTLFLQSGLVDELRVAIAPFIVGEKNAPRFVLAGSFPNSSCSRMKLISVKQAGDMSVLRYRI